MQLDNRGSSDTAVFICAMRSSEFVGITIDNWKMSGEDILSKHRTGGVSIVLGPNEYPRTAGMIVSTPRKIWLSVVI